MTQAPGHQTEPSVASDGEQFLAVWIDPRSAEVRQLYASRLDADGNALDPLGIVLTEWPRDVFAFDVAFGRSSYLVVDSDLETTEIGRKGEILRRHETSLRGGLPPSNMALVWTGSRYVAVWGYNEVRAAFFDEHGVPDGEARALVSANFSQKAVQDVSANGSSILLLYNDGGSLRLQALDRWGIAAAESRLLEEHNAITSSSGPAPRGTAEAATDGRNYFIVWRDWQAEAIEGQLVGAAGEPLTDVQTIARRDGGVPVTPRVTWNGAEFVVSYYRGDTILAPGELETVRVASDGSMISGASVDFRTDETGVVHFATASAGVSSIFVGAFQHPNSPDLSTEIYAKRLGAGDLKLVTRGHPAMTDASIAVLNGAQLTVSEALVDAGRSTFLVLSNSSSGIGYRIFDNDGHPLTEPRTLPAERGRFAAAWNGHTYAIARTSLHTIDVLTLAENGEVIGTSASLPISSPMGFAKPAIACNDSVCIAAWIQVLVTSTCPRLGCTVFTPEIDVARFTLGGTLIDSSPFTVTKNVSIASPFAMTAAGEEFFIAWDTGGGPRVAALDRHGFPIAETLIAEEPPFRAAANVAIAAIGSDAVVAWERTCCDALVAAVVRRDRSGISVSDPVTVSDQFAPQRPALASTGDGVVIAYDRVSQERGVPTIFTRQLTPGTPRRRAAQAGGTRP